ELYQAQDQLVFPITGTGEVNRYLTIATNIFEWDAGDVESANEVLGAIGDAAVGIGTIVGGIGATVGAILKVVLEFIGAIVKLFGGDPDNLGLATMQWTATDLQKMTAGGSYAGRIQFINDDDTGSYELSFTIT